MGSSGTHDSVPGCRPRIAYRDGIGRTLDWFDAALARRHLPPETAVAVERLLAAYAKAWPEGKLG